MVMTVTKCAVCYESCIHNRWQEPNCDKCRTQLVHLKARIAELEAERERLRQTLMVWMNDNKFIDYISKGLGHKI